MPIANQIARAINNLLGVILMTLIGLLAWLGHRWRVIVAVVLLGILVLWSLPLLGFAALAATLWAILHWSFSTLVVLLLVLALTFMGAIAWHFGQPLITAIFWGMAALLALWRMGMVSSAPPTVTFSPQSIVLLLIAVGTLVLLSSLFPPRTLLQRQDGTPSAAQSTAAPTTPPAPRTIPVILPETREALARTVASIVIGAILLALLVYGGIVAWKLGSQSIAAMDPPPPPVTLVHVPPTPPSPSPFVVEIRGCGPGSCMEPAITYEEGVRRLDAVARKAAQKAKANVPPPQEAK